MTLKANTISHEMVIGWLGKIGSKKWVFQLEKGGSGDYMHYQIMFSLQEKTRFSTLLKKIQDNKWFPKCHLSPQSANGKNDWKYAEKEETRVGGPWSSSDVKPYIPRQIREIDSLYPWQQAVIANIGVWTTRIINVIVCVHGNIGKSILAGHIRAHGLGKVLPLIKNYKDLLRVVYGLPTATMYLVDMPRAIKQENMGEMYGALETLKDGFAYDDRYTYKEKVFDSPNVWVFTNTLPDLSFLSRDRWLFWEVVDKKLVKYQAPITADAPTGVQDSPQSMGQPRAAADFARNR